MFTQRKDAAIFSQIDKSLNRLTAEFEDLNCTGLDFSVLKPQIRQQLEQFFVEPDADDNEEVTIEFGSSPDTCPLAFANTLVFKFAADVIEQVKGVIDDLAKREIGKVDRWMKMNYGETYRLDFSHLRAIDVADEEIQEFIDSAQQVLDEDREKLAALIARIPDNDGGLKGFIRDLGAARLNVEGMDQMLRSLLEVEDPDIIDQVINAPEVKNGDHASAVVFLGKQLKRKLSKSRSDSSQKAA